MLGLLPWEEWLPPYIFGPLLCVGSVLLLVFDTDPSWWKFLLCLFGAIFGARGTWIWFSTGKNIFLLTPPKPNNDRASESKD
jgi:hypothetical protein